MRKTLSLLLSICIILGSGISTKSYANTNGVQAAWLTTAWSLDWPKAKNNPTAQKNELIEILDILKDTGINTVMFQVRPYGDAMYKSNINPWSKELTGTQGKDPGYDPLEFIVQEAHTRGMKVHAWLNPYRVISSGTDINVLSSNHPARKNPSLLIENNGGMYYNPDLQEVKDHISDTVGEIVSNYDIDGIVFDDYFYPTDYPLPQGEGKDGVVANARREHINQMILKVKNTIKSIKPEVKFGVSPRGVWKNKVNDPDTPKYSYQTLGPAPSFMNQNTKYYSYDGNYFYTDINQLISDAKLDNHNNAINSNNPYYNYYQYLPGRSKTSYTSDDINRYFEQYTPSDSLLRNTGSYFIKAQNEYGTNAALLVGIAMNESDRGTSNLAKTKFNVFGTNAKDGYVQGADKFSSIEECIMRVSNYSFSNGYFNPKSWKYNSSSLGNKSLGANVRYASDPFWSEKAISRMYQLDKFLGGDTGLKDYNRYLLGMYTNETSVKNTLNKELYSILPQNTRTKNTCKGQVGDTTIVLNEKDSNNYNIRPDRIVPITETNINGDGTYLWDRDGVINKTNIKIINEKSNPNTDFTTHWAKSYIIDGMNKGWVDTANVFKPENFITRAEFIKIVNRAFNITQIGEESFRDVNPGDWFYDEVRIAINAGYINGRGNGIFAPYDPITRQEAAKIIGYITNKIDYNFTYLSAFNDGNTVLDWAKPYVEGVLKAGYMNGYAEDNTFKPSDNIKRAEAVTILSRTKM